MIDSTLELIRLVTKTQRRMRLRIKVNNQHSPAFLSKRGGEVHCRGCFAASTLLIRDHYRFHMSLRNSSRGQFNDFLHVSRWQPA